MSRKNDMSRIVGELAAIAGPSVEYTGTQEPNPQAVCAKTLIRRTLTFPLAAIAAGDTLARTASPYQFKAPYPGRILGATLNPAGASAADNANNQTVNVVKNATVMASITTNVATGSLVAGTPKDLTLSATQANRHFAQGDVLGPSVAAAGTGVAIAACTLQVEIEMEGPIDGATASVPTDFSV